jgi:hypothetical protein
MNPPPVPVVSPDGKKSFAGRAALGSLVTALIAIPLAALTLMPREGPSVPSGAVTIAAAFCLLLVLAGIALAIMAMCGMQRHNRVRILSLGLTSLIISSTLVLLVAIDFFRGFNKGIQNRIEQRKASAELQASSQELQARVKESYDPEKGITNFDSSQLDRMQRELQNASQKLSGDDAVIMRVMGNHMARMQQALRKYEAALTTLTETEVLDAGNLTDKAQIVSRRKIVRNFLSANADFKQVIASSEKNIREELAQAKIATAKLEAAMQGFNSKAAPRTALTLRIRDCDQRIGDTVLGALEVFEAQWGQWQYDPAGEQIEFTDEKAAEAYQGFIDALNEAAEEQVKLQGRLVNLP